MREQILISVNHVSRFFGDYCAVADISFSVQRGEVLGFLGPNGAGKTTTVQIICGVLAASTGKVSIAGHDIVDNAKQAKSHLGFLPERPPLYLDLTVDEYLSYCAHLHGIHKSKLKQAIANSKARCGLEQAGKRLIANLSKGYQQRVGIAQAIIHSPAIVILDEPTVGLDPIQIMEIRELITELGEDHSVILSTHILTEVQSTCDRVLIINQGNLVLDEQLTSLHKNNSQATLSAAFQQPPLIEELESLVGIKAVTRIDRQRFKINYQIDSNVATLLSETSTANGWGLFELIPGGDSLEETFVRLIRGDNE